MIVSHVHQVITSRTEDQVSVWNVLWVNTNQTLDNLHAKLVMLVVTVT